MTGGALPPFDAKDKGTKEAVASTEKYIREQVGDARPFNLDSPKSPRSADRDFTEGGIGLK